jgi:hypothetical protein
MGGRESRLQERFAGTAQVLESPRECNVISVRQGAAAPWSEHEVNLIAGLSLQTMPVRNPRPSISTHITRLG